MAYEWTEGGWWPRRHEPPGNLEVALENFAASARGEFGQVAAFGARSMLHQHFQYSHELCRSSFTPHWQSPTDGRHEDSNGTPQESPTDSDILHDDSNCIPQYGCSPWQPLHHKDDVSRRTDDCEQPLHEDDMVDDSTLDATGNDGPGFRAPGMGGSALRTELPSYGTSESCRGVGHIMMSKCGCHRCSPARSSRKRGASDKAQAPQQPRGLGPQRQ